MSSKGKGNSKRETKNSNKTATPRIRILPTLPDTPTTSMLTTPKHSDASPSYAAVAASPPGSFLTTDLHSHIQQAIHEFQIQIQKTLDELMSGMKKLETELNKSIEFQSERIDELEAKVTPLEVENSKLRKEVDSLSESLQQNSELINKQERFSRRNNFRIVGVPTTENENCVEFVEDLITTKFAMPGVTVERAHRDGRGIAGKSPHLLVKLLSYRDKVDIIRSAKSVLKEQSYFILDDLTKPDLAEKKKWGQQVKQLYREGTKLKFSAGKWRRNGQPYVFNK